MPELPEVETIRRGLNETTCHQRIAGGEVLLSRTIAHPQDSEAFLSGLLGSEIRHWQRRGKYLLAELERDGGAAGWLGVHLRMTGQLLWLKAEAPLDRHTRLRLQFQTPNDRPFPSELRFIDTRTFGQAWWIPADRAPSEIIAPLKTLGPEPLSSDFSADYLEKRLKKSKRPLKSALLDQRVVAGLGNIYADECLFLSGLHPQRFTHQLQRQAVERLVQAIVTVLEAGIAAGGTTLRDYRTVEGVNGNYGGQAWVYRRTGEPCRQCQTPIERFKLGGRSTHFCPQCQPKA